MGVSLILFIDCICPPKKYENDKNYREFDEVKKSFKFNPLTSNILLVGLLLE
jgi:hypothetical protein